MSGRSPSGSAYRGAFYRLELRNTPPRKLELLAESTGPGSISPDGRTLVSGWGPGLGLRAYPPAAEPLKSFARGSEIVARPFFSADGRAIYAHFLGNLVMFPLSPDRSIGEPVVLRPWLTSPRFGGAAGAASRDGKRLLLIETDQAEALNPQVLTDWTTLLPK